MNLLSTPCTHLHSAEDFKDGHVIVVSNQWLEVVLMTSLCVLDETLEGRVPFRKVVPGTAFGELLNGENSVATAEGVRGT